MNSYRLKFEQDLGDILLFFGELLRVMWSLNPVAAVSSDCQEAIEEIGEDTSNPDRANIIADALTSVELTDPAEFIDLYTSIVEGMIADVSVDYREKLFRLYPELEAFLTDACSRDSSSLVSLFRQMTIDAIRSQDVHYQAQLRHFEQLNRFLPRYVEIMTSENSLLQMAVHFAVGYFTGGVGVAGLTVWENWRESSDKEFVGKFAAAFGEFVESGVAYTRDGEAALAPVIDRLLEEVRSAEALMFDGFDRLEANGWDLGPFYDLWRSSEGSEEVDDDVKGLFQETLANLQRNPAVSSRSLLNLRELFKPYFV